MVKWIMHFQACFPYPNLSLTKTAIFWNYVSDLVGLHKEYKNYFFSLITSRQTSFRNNVNLYSPPHCLQAKYRVKGYNTIIQDPRSAFFVNEHDTLVDFTV